jgi:hypothetical protein
MLDEGWFLGPHGIRSIAKWHEDHPYTIDVEGQAHTVGYEPAESRNGMFAGNSNWRGPVWFPINLLLIRALLQFHRYYGDSFRIECPTGSGHEMNLYEVAEELGRRLAGDVHPRRAGTPSSLRRCRAVPGGPGVGGQPAVLRVLPRRQRRRDRRLSSDRLDRRGRSPHPDLRKRSSREGDALTVAGHDCQSYGAAGRSSR